MKQNEKSIKELIEANRKAEMKAICAFIYKATMKELCTIVEEVRCYHDNLMIWHSDLNLFIKVERVTYNPHDECIQINTKKGCE